MIFRNPNQTMEVVLKDDDWNGMDAYTRPIRSGWATMVQFSKVTTDTEALEKCHITLYLDDTSNGRTGLGNTRILSLDHTQHFNGKNGMHISNVNWPMMGAIRDRNAFPMPDVAKVVVTAETLNEKGEMVHGIIGGDLMPLEAMFEGLMGPSKKFSMSIYNSFFKLPHAKDMKKSSITVTDLANISDLVESPENDPGEPHLTLEFHAGPNIKQEYAMYKAAYEKGLFKPSELPTIGESWVISNMLSPVVKELFVANMAKGVYNTPMEAPPGFNSMPFKNKFDTVDKIPRFGMFLEAETPNARIKGQHFPHALAILPAMHNEMEQYGMTNKRILMHSLHGAFTVFQNAYGWSAHDIFEGALELVEGRTYRLLPGAPAAAAASKMVVGINPNTTNSSIPPHGILSFMGANLTLSDNLSSTQTYVPDMWIARNPMNSKGKWIPIMGEDWGSANSIRAVWSPEKSTGGPSASNDCESSAAANLSKLLGLKDIGVGSVREVLERIWNTIVGPFAKKTKKLIKRGKEHAQKRGWMKLNAITHEGIDPMPFDGMDEEAYKDWPSFLRNRAEYYKNNTEKENMDAQAYLDSLATMAHLAAKPGLLDFSIVLGTAFSAKQDSTKVGKEVDTRQTGGHAYSIGVWNPPSISTKKNMAGTPLEKQSIINEGTAEVIDRQNAESAAQTKSGMLASKGLVLVLLSNKKLDSEQDAWHNFEPRPLMTSCSEPTKDFYDLAFVKSKAMTYSEAMDALEKKEGIGAFFFTKDATNLSFGIEPERADRSNVVCAAITGGTADAMIAAKDTFQKACKTINSEFSNPSTPLTSSFKASLKSVRELCPARVSYDDWETWMDRMYGTTLPELKIHGSRQGNQFHQAGKVATVVATFKSAADMEKHGPIIEKWWKGLGKDGKLEKQIQTIKTTMLPNGSELQALDHLERTLMDENIPGGSKGLRFTTGRTLNTILLFAKVRGEGMIPKEVAKVPAMVVASASKSMDAIRGGGSLMDRIKGELKTFVDHWKKQTKGYKKGYEVEHEFTQTQKRNLRDILCGALGFTDDTPSGYEQVFYLEYVPTPKRPFGAVLSATINDSSIYVGEKCD